MEPRGCYEGNFNTGEAVQPAGQVGRRKGQSRDEGGQGEGEKSTGKYSVGVSRGGGAEVAKCVMALG